MYLALALVALAVAFAVAYKRSPKFRAWLGREEAAVKAEAAKLERKTVTQVGTAGTPTGTGSEPPTAA